MRVWRLCKSRHAAFDGEGARLAGGRWNPRGVAVVYTSESISLAALELLVHCEPALAPDDLVAISADLPESIRVRRVETAELPRNWRRYPASEAVARIGARWLARSETAVLSVPSALVPRERNFLLNPAHSDFRRISIGQPEPFELDARLGKSRVQASDSRREA